MTTATLKRRLFKTPMRDLIRGRVTGRLDIDLLLDDSALPKDAADNVRRVVKHTRLKRLEKVDVANELIAHFQDGLEAETPIEELLKSFGDEKQTARLIRRAKKRQRPLAWHIFAWARLTVVCFLGFYILSALYLLTGSPTIKTDYLAQLNEKSASVPSTEAAWPIYREALLELNLYEEREWDSPIPYYSDLPPEESEESERIVSHTTSGNPYIERPYQLEPPFRSTLWTRLERSLHPEDPGWSATVTFLNEHYAELDLLRRGASLPGLGFNAGFYEDFSPLDRQALCVNGPPQENDPSVTSYRDLERALIGVQLPHLPKMRDMAKLLAADAARAAQDGDAQSVYDNLTAIFGIADQADEQPLLLSGLVNLAIHQIGYGTMQHILIDHPDLLTNDQLRNLAHQLASMEVPYEQWYNGERFWFYDYLQRIYTDDGQGDGRITNEGIVASSEFSGPEFTAFEPSMGQKTAIAASMPVAAFLIAPRAEMRQMYDNLMDRAIAEVEIPLWEKSKTETFDEAFEKIDNSVAMRARYLPVTIFMPSLSAVKRSLQTEAGYREGQMIGIALTLYHREHGDWPQSLQDLSPRYLPSIPRDRLTGDPVRYRLTDTGPIVYSFGLDLDDDDATPPTWGEEVRNLMASPKKPPYQGDMQERLYGDWLLYPNPDY